MNNNLGIILDPNSFKNIKEVVKKADNYNFHSAWVTELYRSSFEQLTFIAEITNGRLAMMGFFALVVNYGLFGWIIPGIF